MLLAVPAMLALAVPALRAQVEPTNLGTVVNSADDDFSPVVTADGNAIYFTSDRPGGSGGQDVWVTRKDASGQWGPPVNLGVLVNTKYNEGPDTLAVDETVMFFTRCDRTGHPGTCDIYTADFNESSLTWTNVRNLGTNINSTFNDANASLSYDEKTLFFVSDRPTEDLKRRNWDVYVSLKEGGAWTQARRIGEPINTMGDEFHVMVHPNNKLIFFSSNGHGGFGGSDIFVSELDCSGAEAIARAVKSPALPGCMIGPPRNLGPPINTPSNDMYFTVAAALDLAYLASDRMDTVGQEDLYVTPFDIELPDKGLIIVHGIVADRTTCAAPTPDPNTGIDVYDIHTCTPIPNAVVRMADVLTDRLVKEGRTGPSGSYKVAIPSGSDYSISATAKGYSFHSERFNVAAAQPFEVIEKNILLDPARGGVAFVINNIYFDFDKATLRPESKNELNNAIRWLQDNPQYRIEIGAHCDSKGSDAYNIRLSQARAQAVVDYLVREGHISPNRLVAFGYGESMPVASNATDEGRQLNRRVEFKILE
jgi:outer membrane protein OmpA-like peptidoglycan-associated protein